MRRRRCWFLYSQNDPLTVTRNSPKFITTLRMCRCRRTSEYCSCKTCVRTAVDIQEQRAFWLKRFTREAIGILKRLFKSGAAASLASGLIEKYIRLVQMTSSWRIDGLEHCRALEKESDEGFIVAFWHARILMAPVLRREINRKFVMLISTHRDGELITNAVKGFGIDFVRGSAANQRKAFKDKGGAPAVTQMIGAIEAGHVVGITPDGPRGPARRTQSGILKLAAMTGRPILPIAYSASNARQLNSWDRFLLALPFSKIRVIAGPPVRVTQADLDADPIGMRRKLEAALDAVTDEADRQTGRFTAVLPPAAQSKVHAS